MSERPRKLQPLRRPAGAIALTAVNTWVATTMVQSWGQGVVLPWQLGAYIAPLALLFGLLSGLAGLRWRTRWVAVTSGLGIGFLAALFAPTGVAPEAALGLGTCALVWAALLCGGPTESVPAPTHGSDEDAD